MSRVCSKNSNGYNPSLDINYIECQIQKILFILGMNEIDFDQLTIDEIIETIRSTFKYDTKSLKLGPDMFVKSINIYMITNIRRLWYWLHFAKQAEI